MQTSDYKFDPSTVFSAPQPYFIKLDQRWKLDDLSEFSKNFEQSYYAVFALEALRFNTSLQRDTQTRLLSQMARYPWRGGFSTIHFYYGVKRIVGRKRQPEITKIQYASPGFIELNLLTEVALNLGAVVAATCGSVKVINSTYNQIYKGLRERQLNEISVEKAQLELAKDQLHFLQHSVEEIGKHLNLENPDKLIEATGNEFRALKILLSMYRRIRVVAQYQEENKILLPKDASENNSDNDGLS